MAHLLTTAIGSQRPEVAESNSEYVLNPFGFGYGWKI